MASPTVFQKDIKLLKSAIRKLLETIIQALGQPEAWNPNAPIHAIMGKKALSNTLAELGALLFTLENSVASKALSTQLLPPPEPVSEADRTLIEAFVTRVRDTENTL